MLKSVVLLSLTVLCLTACKKDKPKPVSNSINKIMPLGASRVEGGKPEYESFRYELWKNLIDGGWDFDFIGSQTDPSEYDTYAGQTFDADHEGRGGWTSTQISEGIADWLELVGSPDIVLFSSPGGNDALQSESYDEAILNINSIIDALQVNNPNVTIIIEIMAPARSDAMTSELTTFLNKLKIDIPTIASAQTNENSSVVVIDLSTDFSESYFADDVHYNAQGAEFVANKYLELLDEVLK